MHPRITPLFVALVVAGIASCRSRGASDVRDVRNVRNVAATSDAATDAAPALVLDAGTSSKAADAADPALASIVVDESGAYWFASARELHAQNPSGEGAPVVLAKAAHAPVALGLDAKRVYWVEDDRDAGGSTGELVAIARADGSKRVLARLARPRGLVLDSPARSAFVVADDTNASSAIYRVPLDGAAATKIASVPVSTTTLAADESSIFVVTDAVLRIPKAGGVAKRVSDSPEEAQAIALVRDDIVFIGSDPQAMTGRVWKMPKRGPAPPPRRAPADDSVTMVMYAGAVPLSGEGGSVTALATDGRRPFWIKSANDADVKVASLEMPNAKGEPVELATVPSESGLAVFRSQLYWSTPAGVKSMPLPR